MRIIPSFAFDTLWGSIGNLTVRRAPLTRTGHVLYRRTPSAPPVLPPFELIIDNLDPGYSELTGGWYAATYPPDYYGSNYRSSGNVPYIQRARWTPTLPRQAQVFILQWWPSAEWLSPNTPFTILHDGGTTIVYKDQSINGGQWNLLGTFTVSPGNSHVTLACAIGQFAAADACRYLTT